MVIETLKRPDLETIRQAHERIKPYIHRTPALTSEDVDGMCGGSSRHSGSYCDALERTAGEEGGGNVDLGNLPF